MSLLEGGQFQRVLFSQVGSSQRQLCRLLSRWCWTWKMWQRRRSWRSWRMGGVEETTRRRRVGTRSLPRPLLPLGPSLPLSHATVTGEGRRSDLFRFSFFKTTPTDHTYRYVKGSLPRLPYCGCVPVRLHLLPERRPHHLIHIDASVEVHCIYIHVRMYMYICMIEITCIG